MQQRNATPCGAPPSAAPVPSAPIRTRSARPHEIPMPRKRLNAEQREAHRVANRKYARTRTKARDHPEEWKRRNNPNESRRAKYDRDFARQKESWKYGILNTFGDHSHTASLITAESLKADTTRWKAPAAQYQKRIAELATEIIERREVLIGMQERAEKLELSYRAAREAHEARKSKKRGPTGVTT